MSEDKRVVGNLRSPRFFFFFFPSYVGSGRDQTKDGWVYLDLERCSVGGSQGMQGWLL